MNEWLRSLLGLHAHQWEDIERFQRLHTNPLTMEEKLVGHVLYQRCAVSGCGKVRSQKL